MLPFHFLMGVMLLISTSMVVSSASWVAVWLALEVNTLSFMPLIKSKNSVKYFLAQSVGSAMILGGVALSVDTFFMVGAAVKAGIAPFHLWLPQVMSSLSWGMCLILSTWQKIAPLSVMASIYSFNMLMFFMVFSCMMGALGAMKQSQLRGVMAYSSIVHMGWIMAGMVESLSLGIFYFFVYCLLSILVFYKLMFHNSKFSMTRDISFVFLLCSMGGLPPFIGFFPKMLILLKGIFMMAVPLMVSSLMMIYVYMNVAFSGVTKLTKDKSGLIIFVILSAPCFYFW
nr:NADH dehydrogenase subunit 2 [Armandia sp. GK-2021]